MQYRPDIDGLRALAVVPVVLFHLDIETFSGGYVGVDVFFVISGYLITGLIAPKVAAGSFSIIDFYERRIRRLFPALFVVFFFTALAAYKFLLPEDLREFGQSLVAATAFVSNMLFWSESGYFDSPAAYKPLLHTWSLAVEEQFYVVYPILLLFVFKVMSRHVVSVTMWIGVISFVLAVWFVEHDPSKAFYWAPMRAWELMLGAFLALGGAPPVTGGFRRTLTASTGMLMLVGSVLLLGENSAFPGINALWPCFGTALLIHSHENGSSWISVLLSSRPLLFVGQISYSLYLWHWPAIVFYQYSSGVSTLSILESMALVVVSLILAMASWRFVEQPFRNRHTLTRSSLFSLAAGLGVLWFGVGGLYHSMNGVPNRLPEDAQVFAAGKLDGNPDRARCHSVNAEVLLSSGPCPLGDRKDIGPQFVVWGDSHADSLMPAFKRLAEELGAYGWYASYSECPPLLDIDFHSRGGKSRECRLFNEAMAELVGRDSVQTVFLVSKWASRSLDMTHPEGAEAATTPFTHGLSETLKRLEYLGKKVVLVKQVPYVGGDPPLQLARAAMAGHSPDRFRMPVQEHIAYQADTEAELDEVTEPFNIDFADPAQVLCDSGYCRVEYSGHSLYRDGHHLSATGAFFVKEVFVPYFLELVNDRRSVSMNLTTGAGL